MNERQRRLTLNLLFWLTMCLLFAALVDLIRSDDWGWLRAMLWLAIALALFFASKLVPFRLLPFSMIGKIWRKTKD
jgi:hypothetical protein